MSAQDIYLSTKSRSPEEAFVFSQLAPVPVEFCELVLTNTVDLNLYLADGEGDFDTISGLAGYSVDMRIGRLATAAVVQLTSWSGISNGWTGSLSLNTSEAIALFAGADYLDAYVQIQITNPSAEPKVYGLKKCRLLNRVLPAGAPGPTPVSEYLTSVETFNQFVQNRSSISGFTGGGATNLDGITTLSKGPGWMIAVTIDDGLYHYQLRSGTHAEDSPNFIRPDDYATTTNEKYWQMRSGPALVVGADPNFVAKEGAYDWQPAFDNVNTARYNWIAASQFWQS